jgi:hypothetical protein
VKKLRFWPQGALIVVFTGVNVWLYAARPAAPAPHVYVCIVHAPLRNGDRVTCR